MRIAKLIACIAVFEAAWFACVAGAAHGHAGWGMAAVLVSIALQLAISNRRGLDLLLMIAAVACGVAWDTALSRSHVVIYSSHLPLQAIAPAWILMLWAQLGSVLREPLSWLHPRPWLAVVLSAIGGAASYAGAARMGAVTFPEPAMAITVLAAGWGVMLPLLLWLARWLDQRGTTGLQMIDTTSSTMPAIDTNHTSERMSGRPKM
jgi:hypothetical protein